MWLLHFLPDAFLSFVVNAVLVAGIAATIVTCFLLKYLVRLMPVLAPNVKIAQIASILLLLSGVYFKGGYSSEMAWRERVTEMQAKVAAAEAESQVANTKLTAVGKSQLKDIHAKHLIVKQYITREVTKYDSTCVIPDAVVKAHNAAASNKELK